MTASICRKTCFGKRGLHIEKDSEDEPAVFRSLMEMPGHAEDRERIKTALLYAAEQAENKAA